MNNIIVLKFGGASVATPEQIRAIAKNISNLHRIGKRIIIVISAMGKTTDQLIELARSVSPFPQRRELDMLLTAGERIAMSLMSMALHDLNCSAISFTGSQAGVLTDGSFSNARIIDIKPIRVAEALEQNRAVVIAGFQGVDPKTKEITTLGRGGSDTTAIAMAAHFKAERCEILKDVDGVYSADPKIVADARIFKNLPIDTLYEFCFWGAKVLNYHSVDWARTHQVPLFIGKSADFSIGTAVSHTLPDSPQQKLSGVNSHAHVLELNVTAADSAEGLSTLHNILQEKFLPMPQVLWQKHQTGRLNIFITDSKDSLDEIQALLRYSDKIRVSSEPISTVTITPQAEMNGQIHSFAKKALRHLPSARSQTFVVPSAQRQEWIKELHAQVVAD